MAQSMVIHNNKRHAPQSWSDATKNQGTMLFSSLSLMVFKENTISWLSQNCCFSMDFSLLSSLKWKFFIND